VLSRQLTGIFCVTVVRSALAGSPSSSSAQTWSFGWVSRRLKSPRTMNGVGPSPAHQRQRTTTRAFRAQKVDAKYRALGRAGECLVLHNQRETLRRKGRPDLAQRVRHVAAKGDGAGYDMLSFSEDGTVKYIEVKTTRGSVETAFFLSANELAFARQHSAHYSLYKLYDYQSQTHSGKGYIITGNLERWCEVTPTQYRLRPRRAWSGSLPNSLRPVAL